ncbi:hypothetical protein BJV77DRAFT_958567 [Russula vinacea]|nr:hypothetical protein BJV77DRAFT_958567 [Russula vinacea]
MSLRYSNTLERQFGVAKPGACRYFGLGMFIDRMGSFKPDYKTMSSKASLYVTSFDTRRQYIKQRMQCHRIAGTSLAPLLTSSRQVTHAGQMPRIFRPQHICRAMQVNDQVQGAWNSGGGGGRGVADAACEEGLQTLRAGGALQISRSRKKKGKENRFKKKPEKPEEEAQKRAKNNGDQK